MIKYKIGVCHLGWCLLNENEKQISKWYETEEDLIEGEFEPENVADNIFKKNENITNKLNELK